MLSKIIRNKNKFCELAGDFIFILAKIIKPEIHRVNEINNKLKESRDKYFVVRKKDKGF